MRSLAIDPAFQLALRLALGAVLLQAVAHKLRDVTAFASAIAAYRLLPESRSSRSAAPCCCRRRDRCPPLRPVP
jgi:uncharacterized membrane protein YphA (DoxX/SURF4 family)